MADRKVIDLGFSVAILSMDGGEPLLTLMTPETEDDEARCLYVAGGEGLHNLRSELAEWLDALDAEPPPEESNENNA